MAPTEITYETDEYTITRHRSKRDNWPSLTAEINTDELDLELHLDMYYYEDGEHGSIQLRSGDFWTQILPEDGILFESVDYSELRIQLPDGFIEDLEAELDAYLINWEEHNGYEVH